MFTYAPSRSAKTALALNDGEGALISDRYKPYVAEAHAYCLVQMTRFIDAHDLASIQPMRKRVQNQDLERAAPWNML